MSATAVPNPTWRAVEQVMGLPISIALRGRQANGAQARRAWTAVLDDLREIDRIFSTYREDSVVNRLDAGLITLAESPPEVAEVLALGERARVESGGAFDVRRRDPHGRTRLDPSGVVKGWAVQRVAAHLDALDDTDYCLSAGGDMVCHVDRPGRPAWRIGVEDPFRPGRLVARIPVRRGAVATSGVAHRGAHVTDARTGQPASGVASVTVLADDLTWADIDATTALALGTGALAWLRGRAGRSGLIVWTDGRIEVWDSAAGGATAGLSLTPAAR